MAIGKLNGKTNYIVLVLTRLLSHLCLSRLRLNLSRKEEKTKWLALLRGFSTLWEFLDHMIDTVLVTLDTTANLPLPHVLARTGQDTSQDSAIEQLTMVAFALSEKYE